MSVGWIARQFRRVSIDTWRAIDADDRDGRPGFDLGVMVVLLATALALTVAWYIGGSEFYDKHFPYKPGTDEAAWLARGYLWEAGITAASCLFIPVIVRACVPGLAAADHVRQIGRVLATPSTWIAIAGGVACAIAWAPKGEGVGVHRLSHAVVLLSLVILLFGYVVETLRPRFGGHAVFVALIPFAMYHYQRPIGEVYGAGVAGLVLVLGDRPWKQAIDRRTVAVLILVTASLTAQEYLGDRAMMDKFFPHAARDPHWGGLYGFGWWAGWRVIGYLVLPALAILFIPGVRVRDQHVSPRGTIQHLWVYAALFAAVFPLVVLASRTAAFQETYPFYKLANRSSTDLWSWEAMYAAQFLSLEFFFRGVMLSCLRRVAGSNAIFVMIVPYCMIHYGKPMPETIGAIGAGLILGTLAMRTRSIWGGVMIHVGVAISMDVLALGYCPPVGKGPCGGPW
ncbi:MAG TPA: type II CAAX endopeptidase family protein [Kofleriaceae bacterium]|nr:type II CAAX endopeptidase family protein [Kofleriaceae bacterium]